MSAYRAELPLEIEAEIMKSVKDHFTKMPFRKLATLSAEDLDNLRELYMEHFFQRYNCHPDILRPTIEIHIGISFFKRTKEYLKARAA